ncbi:MAG: DUF11 domain-containing protein [Gammaproteobacteria bacterium]|nr:DUF11 domain-containing protein [Gammaproteobacteria bacterium]
MKKRLLISVALLFLTACGSEDAFYGDSANPSPGNTNTSTGGDNTSTGGDTATNPIIRIGSGSGSSFVSGVLDIGLSSLSAGASTGITVDLVDEAGNLYTTPTDVVFNSECEKTGLSELTSPASTFAGRASSTYIAKGCSGSDKIIATAVVSGIPLQATGTVNVLPAALGSIQFISATPTNIALRGTGGAGLEETSTVIFKVLNAVGGPVADEEVIFSLNTTIGGLALTPKTGTTNSQGEVQTVVQSGTVSTPIRITATVTNSSPQLKTQSDQLTITTGLPDQNSFSLSATTLNPEAWNHDGVEVAVTARLADRFNNPVPDGTAITFTTEGGSIEGSCLTSGGACSVIWTSQDVRPCGQALGINSIVGADIDVALNNCVATGAPNIGPQSGDAPLGQPYGGRATITATAVGEESFTDENGNFVFDDGEAFTDLPEAFLDINENSVFNSGQDIFFDFNEDGQYNAADGKFNGVLCKHPTLCSAKQTLHVRDSLVLVMSGSGAYLSANPTTITIPNGGVGSTTVQLSDLHNQPMPAGTTVKVETTAGTLISDGSFSINNTNYNGGIGFGISIEGQGEDDGDSGVAIISITTPKGVEGGLAISVIEEAKPSADLSVSMTGPATATLNATETYTVQITNNGPNDAAGVIVTVTLADSATYQSHTATGNCFGSPLVCNLGDIVNGDTATVTVNAILTTAEVITNKAAATSTMRDLNSGNNEGGLNTVVN